MLVKEVPYHLSHTSSPYPRFSIGVDMASWTLSSPALSLFLLHITSEKSACAMRECVIINKTFKTLLKTKEKDN
jgi:hypothetical protein